MDQDSEKPRVIGAIDVGTNAARLELVRTHPNGGFDTLYYEKAPVRPGEGVFESGIMNDAVADRLVATVQRFAARCQRHDAQVRAVATSALRHARNADAVLQRVHEEAGIQLEVISGKEEARLICLGACRGRPNDERALVLDIGGGSTEVALALGGSPRDLWSIPLGAVRLTEVFGTADEDKKKVVKLMRAYAQHVFAEALAEPIEGCLDVTFGCSGTIRAVTDFASTDKPTQASAKELSSATKRLIAMSPAQRLERFSERRADIIVAGAIILETLMVTLGLRSVVALDRGLRSGIVVDLQERARILPRERRLVDEAIRIGRKFDFEEPHGRQVARLALQLFEDLTPVHGLLPGVRSLLEVAAWLHDVGKAVSFREHHKHGRYLIQNTEILGFDDHERTLAACVARFHRRSPPNKSHPDLVDLSHEDVRIVRRLATILRLANALDRSNQQRVDEMETAITDDHVRIEIRSSQDLELEIWDGMREAQLFRDVFGYSLVLKATDVS